MPLINPPSESFWQAQKAADLGRVSDYESEVETYRQPHGVSGLDAAFAVTARRQKAKSRVLSPSAETRRVRRSKGESPVQPPKRVKAQPHSQRQELPEHIYFHVPGPCVAKPRQTRADKWLKRPCVLRYRAWADKARLEMRKIAGVSRLETARTIHVKVYLPMPASWLAKKKHEMRGLPHRQKPDADNLLKSCADSLVRKDETIYRKEIYKEWAIEGSERTEIYITT